MGAFSAGRFTKGLLAVVAAFVAAVLAAGTPIARADEYQPGYPKLGRDSELVYGHDLYRDGALGTQLLTVHTDDRGGRILAYCIELDVHSEWGGEMKQTDFSAFPGSNEFAKNPQVRSKVSWIIHRSYPQTGVAQVAAAADVPGLTEREAITATQAAIWHLTDNFTFDGLHSWEEPRHDTTSERAQRVKKLYDYLLGPANTGLPESSGPSVEVTVPKTPGTSGELVGPIRFESDQATVKLTSELKYELVDKDGKAVDKNAVPTGTDLFLKVPADAPAGEQEFKVSATGSVYAGKLLISKGKRSQTIIIGSNKEVTVEASAVLKWNAVPKATTPAPSNTPSASTPAPQPSKSESSAPKPTTPRKPGLPRTGTI